MRLGINLLITKLAAGLSRMLGRGGGHALPGLLAERLDPHLARRLAVQLPHGVILVTGTNGKTTTTKLLAAALRAGGETVLTNSTGSNLKRGVTSALIDAADLRGRIKASIGLFEVDEASVRLVAPELMPRTIVVLNLFRDQLDRYGELDITAALIGEGIAATEADLILNADDPLVASLSKYAASGHAARFFGLEAASIGSKGSDNTAIDSDRCPVCRARLRFSRVYYGHIGHYRCPNGDFRRPAPEAAVTKVSRSDLSGTKFELSLGRDHLAMQLPLAGTYNLYNALAAAAVAHSLGVAADTMAGAVANAEAAFGRVERVELDGRTLYLLLIKNPAGFAQVLDTFLAGREHLKILMAINDLDADGRDVSWLWDVPLEQLAGAKPRVVTAGIRSADMALRLHYAGIPSTMAGDLDTALDELMKITPAGGTAFVLPTYTAMLQLRKVLSKLTQMAEV